MEPLIISLPEVNNIDVGLVHGLDVTHLRVKAHGNGAVNASHSHTVSGLDTVNLCKFKLGQMMPAQKSNTVECQNPNAIGSRTFNFCPGAFFVR